MLKDTDSIFGVSMNIVKTYAIRYRIAVSLCILLDIIVVVVACVLLYARGTPSYALEICFAVAILTNFLIFACTKSELSEVFIFYLKNKSKNTEVKRYDINADKLFSVLYCTGYKGVKVDCSMDTYKEVMNMACMQRRGYAKKIVKYLKQYESIDGNFEIIICNGSYISVKES